MLQITELLSLLPIAVGCTGTPEAFAINVKPTPDVSQPPDQVICNGSSTNAIIFNGSVNGTIFSWTNTATSIGLPASGSGNIASFIANSNGNSTSVATITVTPNALGCPGSPKSFTITVNPIPDLVQPPNQSLCNGTVTNLITFAGTLNNIATYTWANSNPSIGLAATGTGDIPAFNAINNSSSSITATITVTPSTSFCPGASKTFTITVNPTPSVVASNSMDVCLGNTAQLSATGASQYFWTR